MKAILCNEFKGPGALRVGDAPPPSPGEGEVRVAVHAAAVTWMDMLMVSGEYQMKPDLPFVPGTDFAGEVLEAGAGVDGFRPGDRVTGTNWYGAFAEETVAPQKKLTPLPPAVSFEGGATILHVYRTALYGLEERARLHPGETLVVHAAAGGVGLATVDVGRHLGARVIGTVGSDDKAALVREYGAEAVINYTTESVKECVRGLTDGRGADVIFDIVGGDVFDESTRCIAWDGRIVIVGFTSGRIPSFPVNLALLKHCAVVGAFAGAWSERFPEQSRAMGARIMDWVAAGHLRPHVQEVLPLEQAAAAMERLKARQVSGRLVLKVR